MPFDGGYNRETSQLQSLNSLIKSMAITEFNLHGYEPAKKKNTLLKMQVPQHFDCVRTVNSNRTTIKDQLIGFDSAQKVFSEDLLIRSTKTSQREIIPFLLMNPNLIREHDLE